MCDFITAVLPEDAAPERWRPIVEEHRLGFDPLAPASAPRQLEPGERYYRATRGECDCGSCLGRARRAAARAAADDAGLARKLARLRREGWSDAKIQRWLADRGGAREKADRSAEHAVTADELDTWLRFLRAMVPAATPYLGLVHATYKRGLADRLDLRARTDLPLASLTPETLAALEPQTLYIVR